MKISDDPVNALTVDVEDYYQVESFVKIIRREDWGYWEPRVERNTHRLLDLFARRRVRGTFFILGWVAERHPRLVREIAHAGHEIACHGYDHQFILHQEREAFRADVRYTKSLLEDITGEAIEGYRAPTYSIMEQTLWALDVLIEEGFRYDSSIFPIRHDRYGIPSAKRFPYSIHSPAGEIVEFPPSTVRVAGQNIPVAGGGYFRLLPYTVFRWGLQRINRCEKEPAIFMVHAWEVDPDQPILPGSRFNIWRHRANLRLTEARLERLLDDFRFAPAREVLRLGERAIPVARPLLAGSGPLYARMARMARMD
jgi:polysaccharide deacetylase family protein (PEP-CTERM system associated)